MIWFLIFAAVLAFRAPSCPALVGGVDTIVSLLKRVKLISFSLSFSAKLHLCVLMNHVFLPTFYTRLVTTYPWGFCIIYFLPDLLSVCALISSPTYLFATSSCSPDFLPPIQLIIQITNALYLRIFLYKLR